MADDFAGLPVSRLEERETSHGRTALVFPELALLTKDITLGWGSAARTNGVA
jgi:hypothetical protein